MKSWQAVTLNRVEKTLEELLPLEKTSLSLAMRYATLEGGKRFRAQLVFAAGEIFNANEKTLAQIAAAIEMIHAYSLVHDDMPAMDNDLLRRGKPSVHAKFGEATALLVGDALQAKAYHVLSQLLLLPEKIVKMIELLSHASGALGMCGGQALDLESVGKKIALATLEEMHRRKTGALLEASVLMGALAGNAQIEDIASLKAYAQALGLCFQITDDILDATGKTETLGKTAGKDEKDQKPTYVSILGLEKAKETAQKYSNEALLALFPYEEKALRLKELATWVLSRES